MTALPSSASDFRGKAAAARRSVDLPFAVSPIVVGVALILFWGATAGSAARCR